MEKQYKSLKAQLEVLKEKTSKQVKLLSDSRNETDISRIEKEQFDEELQTVLRDKLYFETKRDKAELELNKAIQLTASLQTKQSEVENKTQDVKKYLITVKANVIEEEKKLNEIMSSLEKYGKIEMKQKEIEASYKLMQRSYDELQLKIKQETALLDDKFQKLKEDKADIRLSKIQIHKQRKALEKREIGLKDFIRKAEGKKKKKYRKK